MLFQHEEGFLKKIPKSEKVKIGPFSKKATAIAERIVRTINEVAPDLKVVHMGAAALEISGQKELDIYALSAPEQFFKYLSALSLSHLGIRSKQTCSFTKFPQMIRQELLIFQGCPNRE